MPISVIDRGQNNHVQIDPETLEALDGTIEFQGSYNVISIGANCASGGGFHFVLGTHCALRLGQNCIPSRLFAYLDRDAKIDIGAFTGFNGNCRLQLHEPGHIQVGDGCLFGGDVEVTISDMHPVFDIVSGERINPAANINISEKVWIGAHSIILKGCTIGRETVIGFGSVVTHDIPPNCVAAGNPARIVREGTTWRHDIGTATISPQ
jgi:acetyltransferase-like isoleucine patch superfamily enzyme